MFIGVAIHFTSFPEGMTGLGFTMASVFPIVHAQLRTGLLSLGPKVAFFSLGCCHKGQVAEHQPLSPLSHPFLGTGKKGQSGAEGKEAVVSALYSSI